MLGRPLGDRIQGSRLRNLKELRPGSAGKSDIRMLFVFDAEREAIFLVAGDKSGQWSRWYDVNIPLAEGRYEQYVDELEKGDRAPRCGPRHSAETPRWRPPRRRPSGRGCGRSRWRGSAATSWRSCGARSG
ncbi:type II toxin-antitoxin system RelE/ParE family toxin [Kitasatospora sp. NPDC091207]|uniref:type II toxin-antitoxin system RelE/ParE family toxin n=1 Tax=Kitasatospora sp. NPDC091207 TaxID=3364083 RepID=UPI00380E2F7F